MQETRPDPDLTPFFHKSGHKANWYAQTFGDGLLSELFQHLNPMTHQRALATEIALAEELRHEGFAVWQN